MRLTILGGGREIGANCYHLALGEQGILLDAGLHPKREGREALPDFAAAPTDVDEILISHAHLDHVGALPIALRHFPRSRVYMTDPTSLLAVRMLRNAVAVARHRAAPDGPLFSHDHVEWVEQVVRTQEPGRPFQLQAKAGEAPQVTFLSSGHLLGAAGILVEHRGRRLFYTGDTCASHQHICRAASYPAGAVDLLLLESTHGADPDPDLEADRGCFSRARRELAAFITRVAERGGSVLLPVFALGRAQEMLGVIEELARAGHIPRLPIYLSGLAHAVCRIYDATRLDSDRRYPELRLDALGYRLLEPERWRDPALLAEPCLLLVTSGMMFPSTASHFLAGRILPEPRHGVAFVGFLDPLSPGHQVARAAPGEPVDLGGEPGPVRVVCEVRRFGFSAHSRASQLIQTALDLRPSRVVLVHGEPEAEEALAARLIGHGLRVTVAAAGDTVEI